MAFLRFIISIVITICIHSYYTNNKEKIKKIKYIGTYLAGIDPYFINIIVLILLNLFW